eukprot:g591.t1
MNKSRELRLALEKIDEFVNFDIDDKVHVFEVTIRVLGGLLSAHVLLKRNPAIAPNYTDSLLNASLDLGHRLLPAFDTVSGIPEMRVNLKTSLFRNSSVSTDFVNQITCSACAGTLIMEMGMLSRLSGQSIFEEKAKTAIRALFNLRSSLGLLGTSVDTHTQHWTRRTSTIGGEVDSTFEYLLKGYVLFGDMEYLTMFTELYTAVMRYMKTPKLTGGYQWIADVNMNNGHITDSWISSLSAFWPGLQALAGLNEEAKNLHANYTDIWMKYAALPEKFSMDGKDRNPGEKGYPLRPELIESTFLIYSTTKDPHYLQVSQLRGRVFLKSLLSTNTSQCGFGGIKDVLTGELDDSMESFFLAESLKYLYLLHSNNTSFINAFVFTTEAHIFPPVQNSESKSNTSFGEIPQECKELCEIPTTSEIEKILLELTKKFPLLKPANEDIGIIQGRRCRACVHITSHLQQLPARTDDEVAKKMDIRSVLKEPREEDILAESRPFHFNVPSIEKQYRVSSTVMCVLSTVNGSDVPRCGKLEPVPAPVLPAHPSRTKVWSPASLILRKFVPRKQGRQGLLVVLDRSSWKELGGVFHEHIKMKRADLPPSQDCPASVARFLSGEEVLDVVSCRDRLVFGKVVISEPVSGCGRIHNVGEMKNAIVVTKLDSCETNQKLDLFRDAGAIGIVMLKATDRKHSRIHYHSDLPVFLIRPKCVEKLIEVVRCQRDSYAMMGKASSTLLQCPKPRSPFSLPAASEETESRVDVTVTKDASTYFSRAVSEGTLSKPAIQHFLTSIGTNSEVLRAFRSQEAGENDEFY